MYLFYINGEYQNMAHGNLYGKFLSKLIYKDTSNSIDYYIRTMKL